MDILTFDNELTDEYGNTMTIVMSYAQAKGYSDEAVNERLYDLYEMLLTAQEDGKPASKIVGKDLSAFCEQYFSDLTFKSRLLQIPQILFRGCLVAFFFELICIFMASESVSEAFRIEVNIGAYLVGFGLGIGFMTVSAVFIAPLVTKNKKRADIANGILIVLWLVAIFATASLGISIMAKSWIVALVAAVYCVVYSVIKLVINYKTYGTIKNLSKQIKKDSYYRKQENKTYEKAILTGWQGRYKRLLRKGKTTEEGFIAVIEKDNKANKVFEVIMDIIFVILIISAGVSNGISGDKIWEVLLFIGILGVFEFFIYKLFIGTSKKMNGICEKLLRECKRSGLTLPDFIDKKLCEY